MIEKIKKISMAFLFIFIFAIVFGNIDVFARIDHGEGEQCFTFDMDFNGFPVNSVTINGYEWDKANYNDHVYHSDDNIYTIVVEAGKKEEQYPWISTAGGLDDYKTYTAVNNPNDDPEITGDEYLLTLVLNNVPYEGTCSSFGMSLQDGPFPVVNTEIVDSEITITISGDELEYHYVASKPDEPDVSRFKFGINSDHSDFLVPFTFGNANYTHNSNPAPNNVTSVTTKQPIHYQYDYDGSGYVTFFINAGASDEYTKIEINGVDYASQAPHTQVEVYEHIMGRASRFEIINVPYNEEGYNVVVEGRRLTDDKTVTGFGWSYKKDTEPGYNPNEDSLFSHGRLEFVQVKYTDIDEVEHVFDSASAYNAARYHGTGEIYEWKDGVKNYTDLRDAWGEALVPYGAELTVRIVPDQGYQLVSITNSPNGFTATDEVGVYKIVINKDNLYGESGFHLGAKFAKVNNVVDSSIDTVKGGTIATTEFDNGTGKLKLNDIGSMSPEREENFVNAVSENGYEIDSYLDISLYNSIYKGGKKDENNNYLSWDTEVTELENPATITLNLNDGLDGSMATVIHEVREDGNIVGYDVIDATYNATNKTLTFATDGFSTYAIASKEIKVPVVSLSANLNALTLNWENQTGVTYEIYRSNYKTKSYKLIKKLEGDTYTNTGLTYGKTYYYRVRACASGKCTAFSNIVYRKVVPNKVENFTVPAVSANAIKLSWDKVATTGYQIQRSTNNKKWTTVKTITKNSTLSFVNTKLSVNKLYYYRIRAYKTVGRTKVYGPWTTLYQRTTPPKPKAGLSMREYEVVNITFAKTAGATHYLVEKSLDGVNYTLLEDLPGPGVLADGGLTTGERYYYRVRACNNDLCGPWASGSIISSTVTPTLALRTTSKRVTVTIGGVEHATGYEIYRATSSKGKYTKVKTLLVEDIAEGDPLAYINATKKGRYYYYKVRAFVTLEDKTVYSSYSSVKKIRSK